MLKDPDFPPNENSLGKLKGDTAGGVLHTGGGTEWVKASEIAEKDSGDRGAQLFEGGIEASDLLQAVQFSWCGSLWK